MMQVELKLAIHMEPGKPVWEAYERWVKKLDEMSRGRIKINIVHSGFIGIEEWDMVKSRQSDIARIFTLNMGPFPMSTVLGLPYLMSAGSRNLSILNSIFERFLYREWADVKVLWLGLMSPSHLHTVQKPVRTLEDFRGLRLQASGLLGEVTRTWGGVPVTPVASGSSDRHNIGTGLYNVLKDGSLDGTVATFEVTKDFKLYEVTRYHTYLNVVRDVNATVMNRETWNSLPSDIQNIFHELNPRAQQELNIAQEKESAEAADLLKEKGHTMIELSPSENNRWVKAAQDMNLKMLAKFDAQGIPATAIAYEISRLAAKGSS